MSTVRFHISSQILCEWLMQNFGHNAKHKKIPGWVYCIDSEYQHSLFQGMIDSDGYQIHDNAWKYTTVNKNLALSFRFLAELLGFSTSIYKTIVSPIKQIGNRIISQSDYYDVVIRKEKSRVHYHDVLHSWYRVRSVNYTNIDKTVYNLTVEDDNSYIADGIVVHNCQDLSIAGKREGIEGARSGLFYQAVRIVKEMRGATNGKYPRFIVWENVQGAFSSNNGNDFKCVLEEICSVGEGRHIDIPKPKKWNKAGEIVGDGYSVAWRQFDALGFGVPQRRKRIYLVGDFDGERAGKVLFESEGVSGYSQSGFEAWKEASRCPQISIGTSDKGMCVNDNSMLFDNHRADCRYDGPLKHAPSICAYYGTGGVNTPFVVKPVDNNSIVSDSEAECDYLAYDVRFTSVGTKQSRGHCYETDNSRTLDTSGNFPDSNHGGVAILQKDDCNACNNSDRLKAFGICSDRSNSMLSDNTDSGIYEATSSRTIDTSGGNPSCNQGGIAIVDMGCRNNSFSVNDGRNGVSVNEDVAHTLRSGRQTYICTNKEENNKNDNSCYCIDNQNRFNCHVTDNYAPTLCARHDYPMSVLTKSSNDNNQKEDDVYSIQESMIGRNDKNGPKGSGYDKDVSFTLNCTDKHAVAYNKENLPIYSATKSNHQARFLENHSGALVATDYIDPPTVYYSCYSTSKASYHTECSKDCSNTLVATDYKDPPTVVKAIDNKNLSVSEAASTLGVNCGMSTGRNDLLVKNKEHDVNYIVRRLTPIECSRLQGFPDWWCCGLSEEEPSEEEMAFWRDVFETHRQLVTHAKKKKTDKEIRKFLKQPYSDSKAYKMWGNGVALPCVYFVLCGIVWADSLTDKEKKEEGA